MDVESSPAPLAPKPRRGRTPSRCCTIICLALVCLLVLLVIILSLTLFKAKNPTTIVDSVALLSLNFSLLTLKLNLTLALGLSIHNPNKVGFKYHDSTALLNFDGRLIGQVPIPAGDIGGHSTEALNLTVTIFADRFLMDNQAYKDVLAGSLPLNTYTRITGKVRVLSFVKLHVVSTTSCDFNVFVYKGTTGDKRCKYKTKL